MNTIVTQIESLQKELEKHESRLESIERLGRLTNMTDEEMNRLIEEKKCLEKKIVENKKQLKSLRWENWKSMIVSVILLGVVYLGYTFYSGQFNAQTDELQSR
ncbi:uncharacterized protein LOC131945201 [Physella acuta]|uniref:uncharacterized protein LOC131945201 n=1 Tax=Physella acuta TaxID=109671 RepID=UPI0027DBF47C|nr:uncharacterized protein LOC131945201 [Physella acuta]